MPDAFARKTYLHAVPDDVLAVRFSLGKRTRALQVRAFLKNLAAASEGPDPGWPLELLVLTPADWRRLLSAPYGWGLARRGEGAVTLLVPAGYPPRLVARWDAVRLRAAQAGVVAPGGVTAYLDAQVGLEWAHALLLSWQSGGQLGAGRAPKAWVREVTAAYLYASLLQALGEGQRLTDLTAWARVQQAGARHAAEEAEAFVYPRAKMPFDDLLWTQSALWLRATVLGEAHGWALSPVAVRQALRARPTPL